MAKKYVNGKLVNTGNVSKYLGGMDAFKYKGTGKRVKIQILKSPKAKPQPPYYHYGDKKYKPSDGIGVGP